MGRILLRNVSRAEPDRTCCGYEPRLPCKVLRTNELLPNRRFLFKCARGSTMEGFWSLLRSWLRPHRGISQEKLPLYLGFFEFVHNVRKRGKALLGALIELLVSKDPGIQ